MKLFKHTLNHCPGAVRNSFENKKKNNNNTKWQQLKGKSNTKYNKLPIGIDLNIVRLIK